MTSMNGPSGRDSASGKHALNEASPDQPPRAQFLTVAEVASLMRVSKMTVYRLVHNGELPAVRVGRSFRRGLTQSNLAARGKPRKLLPLRPPLRRSL